ncbi:MAG TPA: hypothetical protein PLX90_11670, partial [Anaerolineales bacterium]|nr:hypothetical protein [Anaerolineales bacterium]
MAEEMLKRTFSVADDVLLTRATNMQQAALTYQSQLANYGITAAMITDFGNAIDDAFAILPDEVKVQQIAIANEVVDQAEEVLRDAIRAIVTRAMLLWGEKSHYVSTFHAENIGNQRRAKLRITGDVVFQVATNLATELATKGVTPAMITAIETATNELKTTMINLLAAEDERRFTTNLRTTSLNAIYETMQEISLAGKNAFADDPVAYYEFVLWA